MQCPFLREARVGRCSCASAGKMIPRTASAASFENCSSATHRECVVYREQGDDTASGDRCPYLIEPLTQYCSAAPVVKYIPYSESVLSRCGSDGYRYCDLYLSLANAGTHAHGHSADIEVPAHLRYAPNHLWFDPGAGDRWHVGIDAFMARVLGPVERIRFLSGGGSRRPGAVFTVHGVDIEIGFPYPLRVLATHDYLRAKPECLTSDPYGQGWLFEGEAAEVRGLLDASAAGEWMHGEVARLSEYLAYQPAGAGPATCADGGVFTTGVVEHLSRERILALFDEFFPTHPKGEPHA